MPNTSLPRKHSETVLPQASSLSTGQDLRQDFWRQAFALKGSITPHVFPNVILVGILSAVICVIAKVCEKYFHINLGLEIAPYEIIGAALGLLLVLRTNAGYDRWWEARKLWGGIVNQSRNLAICGLCYGPKDPAWRARFVSLIAVLPHVIRLNLRGENMSDELSALIGEDLTAQLSKADHQPSLVAFWLSQCLREACDKHNMDRFAFAQAERERSSLIDHLGACERILKTPLASAYSIKIRRFIALFLLTLPFALIHSLNNDWLVPIISMMVAYPLFSLDQLGIELQNPFNVNHLDHLPLDEISRGIERNVTAMLRLESAEENDLLQGLCSEKS